MRFAYTVENLGPKRERTPEGYLICYDVPIARVGTQLYRNGEIPVSPGPDGVIHVTRDEDQVFRAETIASAWGKSFVDEHPMTGDAMDEGWDVNPSNWREYTKGVLLHPRRGEGTMSDYLLGDLMITDASAIDAVLDGKVELSCGYNADYETLGPGRGRQHNILINHVALVQQGRCGSRCSIGDEDMTRTRDEASKPKNPTLAKAMTALDRIRDAFKAKTLDEAMLTEGMKEVKDGLEGAATAGAGEGGESSSGSAQHIHVHLNGSAGASSDADPPAPDAGAGEGDTPSDPMKAVAARLDRVEALFTKFAPILEKLAGGGEGEAEAEGESEETQDEATGEEDEDGKKPTKDNATVRSRDSVHLQTSFQDAVSKAEILCPGISVPTFDSKLPAAKTLDAVCGFRRKVLGQAWKDPDTKPVMEPLLAGADLAKTLPKMTCDSVLMLFNGAAEMKRQANNARLPRRTADDNNKPARVQSLADVNARNRETYGQPKRG